MVTWIPSVNMNVVFMHSHQRHFGKLVCLTHMETRFLFTIWYNWIYFQCSIFYLCNNYMHTFSLGYWCAFPFLFYSISVFSILFNSTLVVTFSLFEILWKYATNRKRGKICELTKCSSQSHSQDAALQQKWEDKRDIWGIQTAKGVFFTVRYFTVWV